MKQSRLDSLSDGIFAIILTLMTFELKIPFMSGVVDDQRLWQAIVHLAPSFLSFVLSFALLFTYWHAHHYIVSVYAKSVNRRLTSINAIFFFFVALIPFSTSLIGNYNQTKLAIIIYALNILAIGIALLWMRSYVLSSGHIEHTFVLSSEKKRGFIRIIAPMVFAVISIVVCFYSTWIAFLLLTLATLFNLFSRSTRLVNWLIKKTKEEIVG